MLSRPEQTIIRNYKKLEYLAHTLSYQAQRMDLSQIIQIPFNTVGYRLAKGFVPVSGLVFFIMMPVAADDNDIKILFRGTKDFDSIIRDLEQDAPGISSFQTAIEQILTTFCEQLKEFVKTREPVSVTICGHSLGAVDAQNFCASLIGHMKIAHHLDDDCKIEDEAEAAAYRKIKTITFAGFNAPGTTSSIAEQALNDLKILREHNILTMECYWLLAGGDAIQQFGQENIFANASCEQVKIHLIKTTTAEKIWQQSFNPQQIFHALTNTINVHRHHYFREEKTEFSYTYYCNNIPAHTLTIQAKLKHKTFFINSPWISLLQNGLRSFMAQIKNNYYGETVTSKYLGVDRNWFHVNLPLISTGSNLQKRIGRLPPIESNWNMQTQMSLFAGGRSLNLPRQLGMFSQTNVRLNLPAQMLNPSDHL